MENNDYDDSWQVCVPENEHQQHNLDALEEYLDNMNFC